jgi:hypothetical protein
LVRLRTGWLGNDVAGANRDSGLAKPIFAFPGYNEEQLVLYMMTMEGKCLLSWRNNVHRVTQAIEPKERADTAPFDRKLPTIAAIYQPHLVDIDYGFFGHFLTPAG